MSLRAAWLPFVDNTQVASVRLRTYNAVKFLAAAGHSVRVLHGGDGPCPDEVLVLQKAYSPQHLELTRRHRSSGGVVVLDLCDNHLVTHHDPVLAERSAHLVRMLDHVDVVSVCTNELGRMVPHPVTLTVNDALDPVDPNRLVPKLTRRLHRKPRVLWFGTVGAHNLPFGIRDLERILPALGRASAKNAFELVVMSNSRRSYKGLHMPPSLSSHYLPWSARSFALVAAASDVAVLPVTLNEVTRGKTSNRVATALQHGMNVVTDPLPSYLEFGNCVRMGDYAEHVLEYLRSAELRAAHLAAGRRIVQRLYAPDVIARQWTQVLEAARGRARRA